MCQCFCLYTPFRSLASKVRSPRSIISMSSPIQKHLVSIHDALPEDASGIARVRHETWLATYPNAEVGVTREDIFAKAFESEDQIGKWRKAIENQAGPRRLWVAKNERGEVVGYSQGKRGQEVNEIFGLYVLPAYQGEGVGRALFARVIEWLGDDMSIQLSTATYSYAAIKLYESFGFKRTGEVMEDMSFASGTKVPSLTMVRPAKA